MEHRMSVVIKPPHYSGVNTYRRLQVFTVAMSVCFCYVLLYVSNIQSCIKIHSEPVRKHSVDDSTFLNRSDSTDYKSFESNLTQASSDIFLHNFYIPLEEAPKSGKKNETIRSSNVTVDNNYQILFLRYVCGSYVKCSKPGTDCVKSKSYLGPYTLTTGLGAGLTVLNCLAFSVVFLSVCFSLRVVRFNSTYELILLCYFASLTLWYVFDLGFYALNLRLSPIVYLERFFYLGSTVWVTALCCYVWSVFSKSFILVSYGGVKCKFFICSIFAWGSPLFSLIYSISTGVTPFQPHNCGESNLLDNECFTSYVTNCLLFEFPFKSLVIVNTILYLLTVINLWCHFHQVNSYLRDACCRNGQLRSQISLYIKLSTAMGLQYFFIVIVTALGLDTYSMLRVIFNALQIRQMLDTLEVPQPKVGSVEEFQGQERMVMILSAVRSSPRLIEKDLRHAVGFVASPQRLNVAITRARALLLILGNPHLLARDPQWRAVIAYCLKQRGYTGCEPPSLPEEEAPSSDVAKSD